MPHNFQSGHVCPNFDVLDNNSIVRLHERQTKIVYTIVSRKYATPFCTLL